MKIFFPNKNSSVNLKVKFSVAMDKVVVNTRWKWDMYTFMLSHFKDFNYDAMSHTVQWLKSKVNIKPKVAIVCGSGLGA